MAAPRRSSSSNSFILNVEPEPLFHDEEIAFSGVNIHNPLWDSGSSFSSSWRNPGDEDPLLPPTNFWAVTRNVLPKIKEQTLQRRTNKDSSHDISCGELVGKVLAVVVMLGTIGGIVVLSLTQNTEAWASSGLIVLDDDAIVEQGMIHTVQKFDCPQRMMADATSFITFQNQNASFCDEEFASDCQCSSTLESVSPKELLSGDLDLGASEDLDVVLLGDTLIENCARGLALEFENDNVMTDRSGMAAVCHQLFRKDSGGRVNGMALGASGDRVGHLLYRLQQDPRILDNLNPKIWWIQIGANDLGEDHCSSESIAWATQPLVQAIKARHPDAKIVLNSIIPSQNWNGDNGKTRQHLNQANEYLRCFAKESNDFQFFDADHIFSIDGPDDSISLNGMRAWGEAIVKKVLEMTT